MTRETLVDVRERSARGGGRRHHHENSAAPPTSQHHHQSAKLLAGWLRASKRSSSCSKQTQQRNQSEESVTPFLYWVESKEAIGKAKMAPPVASASADAKGGGASTPQTVASSPFFHPTTPHVVIVQHTPRGSRQSVTVPMSEVHEHKSGLVGCTANLMNAIVGSGIVGIPYAIKQSGFVAGVFLVLLCAVLTEKSLRLLIATAKHVHCPTYETAAESAYGVWGFRFIAINMFIMAYGALVSYLMTVKDSFSVMMGIDAEDFPRKRAVLFIVSICVMVPLSSQRDMADLAVTSRFSVVIDALLVSLVALNSPIKANLAKNSWNIRDDIIRTDTIFVGLGVLSFAYVCQHSAFLVAGSLERPTIRRWSIVTGISLVLCATLALACGISGYLGYLDATQGNILNSLDAYSWSANVARGMLGTTMLFVYPLESFVARHVCIVLLFSGTYLRRYSRVGLKEHDPVLDLTDFLFVVGLSNIRTTRSRRRRCIYPKSARSEDWIDGHAVRIGGATCCLFRKHGVGAGSYGCDRRIMP